MRKQKSSFSRVIIITLLTFFWLALSLFDFFYKLNNNTQEIVNTKLTETANQTANFINNKLNDGKSQIELLAEMFINDDNIDNQDILSFLNRSIEHNDFDAIITTTLSGKSIGKNGEIIDFSKYEFFEDVKKGNCGITDTLPSLYNNSDIFIIYAPLSLETGENVFGSIIGVLSEKTFVNTLSLNSFGGEGYANIVNKDGKIMFSTLNAPVIYDSSNNMWNMFEGIQFSQGSINKIKADFNNGASGGAIYTLNNVKTISYYTPVGINDWYVMQSVPASYLISQTKPTQTMAIMLIAKTLFAFAIIISYIFFQRNQSEKIIIHANKNANIKNEMLRIALSHAQTAVFEYNFKTDRIEFLGENSSWLDFEQTIDNAVNTILNSGVIYFESKKNFENIFNKISQKSPTEEKILQIFNGDDFAWHRFTLTNIFDSENNVISTIGTIEDVTSFVLQQQRYEAEQKYCEQMLKQGQRIYIINISKDEFSKVDSNGNGMEKGKQVPYTDRILHFAKKYIHPEDKAKYLSIALPDNLNAAFNNGITEQICEYRTIEASGDVIWNSSITHILFDQTSGSLIAYTYAKNITQIKEEEAQLKFRAERDFLTGLYNRQTAKMLITSILNNSDESKIHAFLEIDIDGFKSVNDNYGHIKGDIVLKQMADIFNSIVRSNDILARMGGDEFIILLQNLHSEQIATDIADRICNQVKSASEKGDMPENVSVSIGISNYPKNGNSFEVLYEKADKALYEAKQNGKNKYIVSNN